MVDRNLPVPATLAQTKEMVTSAVRVVLSGRHQSLGVSHKWLIKHIDRLALVQSEVETLISVKTDFDGSLVHAVNLMATGMTADEVYGCYNAVRSISIQGESVAVIKVARLIRAFAEADPENDGLDEMIVQAHEVIKRRYFWVKYINQSITVLCAIAEAYGCATIGGALSLIDSNGTKLDGVFNNDEDDEVETHRIDYQQRRNSS